MSAPTVPATPIPLGVVGETGATRPPLDENAVARMQPDPDLVRKRSEPENTLGVDSSVDDPADLSQAGWGVLFASDADPAIKNALQPLLKWRQSIVNDVKLFRVFDGPAGVRPSQTASSWAANKGVSLTAPVNPLKGVPYYLMIVGSPQRISFDFQAQLDLQWAVGRLHFEKVEDYAAYAEKLVEYEKGKAAPRSRQAAIWIPKNQGDLATSFLASSVGPDFLGKAGDGTPPLGQRQKFRVASFIGDGQATKANLTAIVNGAIDGGPPAVVFTGSHGAEWSINTPDVQKLKQGALVTQEWTRGARLTGSNCFTGDDVNSKAKVQGLMAFVFACFGGGCPATDSYAYEADGKKIPLTPEPLIAALPKALLRSGALAVVAHVDRAFTYGFEDVMGTPQVQLFRTPLELLMKGKPVGLAADALNLQWSSAAALLGMALGGNLPGKPQPSNSTLANLFIARDDAKNYMVLGDPAARLDVSQLS